VSRNISRRTALGTGAAGILAGTSRARNAHAWNPGPKEQLKKDLTPGKTTIRQAINIKREGDETPDRMIKRIRDAGYASVKGARHPGGNVGEPWHSMSMKERGEIVAACEKYDVTIYEVGGYTNLMHPDPATLRKNLAGLAHCIEVAESVNCPMVGTIAGSRDPVNFFNVHPDNWTDETWKILVNSIRQVLRDTSGMKAGLGMEAQVTTNLDSPEAHKRLLEDVGDPRCVVNLDPVNMMSLKDYYHTTELIEKCFDMLGESIMGCHSKDTYIWPDKQTVHVQEICPGKGVLDFETYLVRMSRLEFPRSLEPEHISDEEYPEAKAYIEKVAKKVGVKFYGS
jgi:sugar phosphate isomerase/epimerase